jgi:transglutaminase-like putative cysteine protease
MKLRIDHHTAYAFTEPVRHVIQTLCLTPLTSPHQTVLQWQVQAPGRLFESPDSFGNLTHTYTAQAPLARGVVRAHGIVQTHAQPVMHDAPHALSPLYYLRATPLAEGHRRLADLAAPILDAGVDETTVIALARAVAERVVYRAGQTDVKTTALEAFDWGSGVCQDQAHVFIAACRSHGVPARYVSGYFYAADAPELASHAWVDVCLDIDARRWFSVDVTHACPMDERHVRLAVGSDYAACPPVKGVRAGGGQEAMDVSVAIEVLA